MAAEKTNIINSAVVVEPVVVDDAKLNRHRRIGGIALFGSSNLSLKNIALVMFSADIALGVWERLR